MAPSTFLSVTVSHRGLLAVGRRDPPDVVVCLRGEHDLSTTAELSATVARATALGDGDVVLDMSRVEFMDASTAGVVARMHEVLQRRSRSLVVRSPSTRARLVLDLCDLADLIGDQPVDTPVAEEVHRREARTA
jgi:anti-anti-sigma factor